jgi:hypothetical protein
MAVDPPFPIVEALRLPGADRTIELKSGFDKQAYESFI